MLGIGNAVMSDDAFGVHAARRLQEGFDYPQGVEVLEGGTLGLDLLPRLEGVDKLLIIDALELKAAPGTLARLTGEEVPRAFASKLSVHQMGMQDLLAVAELMGQLPGEILVWGAQPESLEMGMELSAPLEGALGYVIEGILADLEAWGQPARHRN